MELLRAQGKDSFEHYQIPRAVIMFRQGFGRLIRTQKDKGMVAVLDPRIKTKYYGKAFLDAIPDCTQLHDLNDVKNFFS